MLTQQRLQQLFNYNPETGIFTRLVATSNFTKAGHVAGTLSKNGYLYMMVDRKNYMAHRLAWIYVYGEFPKNEIDHINGIEDDNKISNLRDVDKFINMQNEVRVRKNNACGLMGAHFRKERNKWVAQLRVNGKSRRFGSFNTPEEAHHAYLKAKRLYHKGFTL